ncbi:hypothetical protein ACFL0G_02035 [Candidatus Zixiibacteriota bacterium]
MRNWTVLLALVLTGIILTGPVRAQEADSLFGKNISVDGVNDFDDPQTEDVDEYLAAIDDEPNTPPEELAPIWSIWNNGWGDAPVEDNWNHWIGPDDDYSANPMDMGKLYVTNDMLYLYVGLTHTDTDGKPQEGGFGYWNTQVGVIIDVGKTPSGGNQSEASPSGYTDPWSNNVELLHEHRPDFIGWFDHHSNDLKFYHWAVDDQWWNEITQDSVDSYYPEFDPGFFTIFGDDGVPNRDQGPFSGPNKFIEFQIPLRALGIDYEAFYGEDDAGLEPPVISVEGLCTQPGRGAYDTVPTDSQLGHFPSMGDWSTGGDKTDLSQYADYILLESLDQVPPAILFEDLPSSVILESAVEDLDRITVVADVSDQTSIGQQSTIGTLDSVVVFYTETAQLLDSLYVIPRDQLEQASRVRMANISGTHLWLADIPDSVYFFIQAEDGTYQSRAPETPAIMDTVLIVFAPPAIKEVSWTEAVPEEKDTLSVFAPDGTILEIPPDILPAGTHVSLSVPSPSTFTEPPAATVQPPHATNGPLTATGIFRRITLPDKGAVNFKKPVRLTFHYIQDQVTGAESRLRLYHWNEGTQRWARAGGRVDATANIVQTMITQTGTYGLFVDPDVSGAIASVIDDVHLDPNPFSPNGDGFYDDLSIQFTLNTNSLLRVEVYDINGRLIKRLLEDRRFLRGGHNVIWNGRDLDGETVPMGFYFIFIFAKSEREELPLAKLTRGVGVIR